MDFWNTAYITNDHQKDEGMVHIGILTVKNSFWRIQPVIKKDKKQGASQREKYGVGIGMLQSNKAKNDYDG